MEFIENMIDPSIFSDNILSKLSIKEIIDTIPAMLFIKDRNSRIVLMNHACEEHWGMTLSDLYGTDGSQFFPSEQMELFLTQDRAVFAAGKQIDYEEQFWNAKLKENRTGHTTKRPIFDADGNPVYLIGITFDITERVHAEAELRESAEKLRGLYELCPLGIALNDMDGKYLEFNEAFRKICGYPSEELQTLDYWALTPRRYEGEEARQLKSLLDTGRYGPYEKEYIRNDGALVPMQLNGMLIVDKNGRNLIWSIVEDITERKRNEAELEQHRYQLEALVQTRTAELLIAKDAADAANHAKSEFLSRMSHELRTPMNAILGFSQLLELDPSLNPRARAQVLEILAGGRHLLALINEVLDLARIEAGSISLSLEPVMLGELLHETLLLAGPLAQQRFIDLATSVPAACVVQADRLRLKQVLLNLLSNAVKYNRLHGRVDVTATLTGTGQVRISVRDTGVGIRAEHLPLLFLPFSRLANGPTNTEGTGIGLTISERLVHLMGGRMGVQSEADVGSEFWIELPAAALAAPPADAQAAVQELVASTDFRTLKVLYVEDNPVNLRLVEAILARHDGINLLTAPSAALGLELARAHRPDLLLLDIQLPDSDGYQVLATLRAEPAMHGLFAVAVTAYAMPADISRALDAGFDAHLPKPIKIVELDALISEAHSRSSKEAVT